MVESDGEMGHRRTVSEVAIINGRPVAVPDVSTPSISSLNVIKSSKIHIGSKVVSVTQNVHSPTVVKDLSLHRYLLDIVKNSSITERLCCTSAVLIVIVCVMLLVYFSGRGLGVLNLDIAPHEWYIRRQTWMFEPFRQSSIKTEFNPLMLVIIHQTVTPECDRYILCAATLRNLQSWYLLFFQYDLPYNFVIGNEGRVYEVRGWNVVGAHTLGYNRCSVGIAFIGDYREEIENHSRVTEAQLNRTQMILAQGVKLGLLRPDFLIVGASDLRPTASPGSNLYASIQKFPNFDHLNRFRGLSCDEIHDLYNNQTLLPY